MLVVHIGPRKTATTYLQSNFYRNRKDLLKRGWLYPVLSIRGRNAHHSLASSLADIRAGRGALVRSMARAGRKAAARNAHILISSEGFRRWKADDFRHLGARFGQTDIVIAYTLRDPLDLLVSVWGESVKNGRATDLISFAEKQLTDPLKSPVLNCLNELAPIKARPELRLVVLNSEALKRAGEDIYTAFCRYVLGQQGMQPFRDKLRNPSFSPEVNDFLRLIARRTDYDPKQSELLFSRQLSRTHGEADLAVITETIRRTAQGAHRPVMLSRDQPWYDALEAKLTATLGDSLVPPAGMPLFPRGMVESVSYDIDRLAENEAVGLLVEKSLARMRRARQRWGRGRIAGLWRSLRRLVSV